MEGQHFLGAVLQRMDKQKNIKKCMGQAQLARCRRAPPERGTLLAAHPRHSAAHGHSQTVCLIICNSCENFQTNQKMAT